MKDELIALGKFLGVSTLGAIVGFLISGWIAAAIYFLLVTILQSLVTIVINGYRAAKNDLYAYQRRLDEEGILAANSIDVQCAACNTPHSIPIIVTQRNLFKCRKCEVENTIIVSAETALTTKPLE